MNFPNLYDGVKEFYVISIIIDYIVEKKNRNKDCLSCQTKTSFPNICKMCDKSICCDKCFMQCRICGKELCYECCGNTCNMCKEILCEKCVMNNSNYNGNLCRYCHLECKRDEDCEKCDELINEDESMMYEGTILCNLCYDSKIYK